MAVTLLDVKNQWDADAVEEVRVAFRQLSDGTVEQAEILQKDLHGLDHWSGSTAEASKHAIGLDVKELKRQARQADTIAKAFAKSHRDIVQVKSSLRNYLTLANDHDISLDLTAVDGSPYFPESKTRSEDVTAALHTLSTELPKLTAKANQIDQELAHAIDTADGEETIAPAHQSPPPSSSAHSRFVPLTFSMLKHIYPGATDAHIRKYLPFLNTAMQAGGINTPLREAAFLSQLGEESGQLVYTKEIADGSEYEGYTGIGNTHRGDGVRYKGRGLIQITGRGTYQGIGKILGLDLINHPELAETPENAVRVSVAYWQWKTSDQGEHLNQIADRGDIRAVSHWVNGANPPTHMENRQRYYDAALHVLRH